MANRFSRVVVPVYAPSFDGRYHGRWPLGNKPASGAELQAAAAALATAGGPLGTAIRLGGGAQGRVASGGSLNTQIRMGAAAQGRVAATAGLNAWGNPDPWVVSFVPGVPATVSFAAYAPPGASNFRLGSGSAALPAGVTLDSANKRLAYDGSGSAIADVTNVVIEDYIPNDAAADWLARISAPGVYWHHSYDDPAEVTQFRWTSGYSGGNDPLGAGAGGNAANFCFHVPSGGVDGGGFMRLRYPQGSVSGRGNCYWYRPFSVLNGASNGRGVSDPGANGSFAAQAFSPGNGTTTTLRWSSDAPINPGFFGPESARSANPSRYMGTDFYFQVRHRRESMPGAPPDEPPFGYITGKSVWPNITLDTSTANEIVVYGQSAGESVVGVRDRHRMYEGANRSGGPGIGGNNETTTINNADSPSDWRYSGGWDTFLYHVTPGTHNGTGSNRGRIEVWAAHEGETAYTKIWDVLYSMAYQRTNNTVNAVPYDGFNALILAIYHNGGIFSSQFDFDYDQVIFSRDFIPCPQA